MSSNFSPIPVFAEQERAKGVATHAVQEVAVALEHEQQAGQLVLTFRHSMRGDVEGAGCLSGASALWSMWPGYLDAPSGEATRNWLDSHGIPLQVAHASGHATVADLQRLARAIDPQRVVPVHTSAPADFPNLFEGAELRRDGEWWDL